MSTTSSSHSENEDFENKEETAQQWVYRHLVEFTNCEDTSAKSLVDGDCSPLIQLLTDMTQTKSLFITVTKPVVLDFSAIVPDSPPLPVPEETKPKASLKKKGKLQALKKKKKKVKDSKKKIKPKKKEKVIPVIVEPPPPVVDATVDMIFEWWTQTDIPHHEQFMFIIPKSRVPNMEARLDELYHVGFMKNRKLLKAALSCLDTVFYDKTSFSMKIDLLLLINEIEDRKMSKELIFERFILENIARNFNLNGRIRNIDSDARSITLILSQTIQTFCFQPDMGERTKLLIQLSFFDIEYLGSFPDIRVTAARLEKALNHISLLQFLYKEEISEWTRKTYLYLLDLFSTILAHEITKKSNFMTNYSPEQKVEPICTSFKKVVQKLVTLVLSQIVQLFPILHFRVSREVFETQEDWSATNKVSFSFYIVGILEEEIDVIFSLFKFQSCVFFQSIIKKVEEMNSETRDMSLDRSAMQATKVILTELDAYLQEKCLESAVESGNLESLRSLAATIVKHNKRLERVVALY
ncbi:hypothetical protein CRE_15443 [Caenorhabditis remanei]|uniref:Uncharacterized protein n=1 Tax=Caenorhabditis remanei TaxID=31234 RepID=E3MCD2_CAERE|nr:hypothetical protein CRE_15443 [Caenorhabditis remanei]